MAHLAIAGGEKACDYAWPRWPVWGAEEREALNGVLESGEWWYGEKVREFEQRFAAFQGARFGITASSGMSTQSAATSTRSAVPIASARAALQEF